MVITLIGYRGTGKTTIGPQLAARLGWDFLDADPEIERRAGRTIRQIFDSEGEPAFRKLEADVLAELLNREKLVLASGGGAVLNPATRIAMRKAGPVVWLQAAVDVIVERLERDPTTGPRRPSLTGLPPRQEIERLLAARESIYSDTSTIDVSTNGRQAGDLVSEIVRRLPKGMAAQNGTEAGL